eukprot:TRINITY_DN30397_c0_g1_i1.p1 TRINITY_DN30397_c0_g1~~TRINITY_DN30397_c0_g1_i1.p1  ORF type:complete len:437 (+),score=62.62 TRINITY_DN30397_c0_g1_i1:48-1358(+)
MEDTLTQVVPVPPAKASPDPKLNAEEGSAHRLKLGYTCPETDGFVCECEFISLGCYCVVSKAFAHFGVRQHSYPFDWVRSPMSGVIQCFQTGFEDFLTYTHTVDKQNVGFGLSQVFVGTRWGGSFWHHDIEQPSVRDDFSRRVDRILGLSDVPKTKPRVFVRLLNSSQELDHALKLMAVLRQTFPDAPIYVLLIVDFQDADRAFNLQGDENDHLLVYFCKRETIYKLAETGGDLDYVHRCKMYVDVLAFACRFWAGGSKNKVLVEEVPACVSQLSHVPSCCKQWYGGDCNSELFAPQYFKGHRLSLSSSRSSEQRHFPELYHGRSVEFTLPPNIIPGGLIAVNIFDSDYTLQLPENAVAGQKMRCRLVEGVLTAVLVKAVTVTVPAAIAVTTVAAATAAAAATMAAVAATAANTIPDLQSTAADNTKTQTSYPEQK